MIAVSPNREKSLIEMKSYNEPPVQPVTNKESTPKRNGNETTRTAATAKATGKSGQARLKLISKTRKLRKIDLRELVIARFGYVAATSQNEQLSKKLNMEIENAQ